MPNPRVGQIQTDVDRGGVTARVVSLHGKQQLVSAIPIEIVILIAAIALAFASVWLLSTDMISLS